MDKVYLNRPNACEVLRTRIRQYKREHPRLNSSQVARKFGVATSSFNRIENNDIRNPSIDQAVKILRGCGSNEDVADFIRMYYPEIHEGLFEYFVESSKTETLDESVEKYFCDESTYKMMMLATSKCGLDENYVLQEFGRAGHKTFMKLAAKGVLVNRDGRFFAASKDVYVTDVMMCNISKYMFEEATQKYNIGEECIGMTALHYESIDLGKIGNDLKALTEDYHMSVQKLLKNPNNHGDQLVAVSSIVNFI
ncbi:MAG: hypothetical protein BM556_09085 [Bacteriovorax sp. MedPE-SWde]|nr:MAG: hypothetical protein BM556_09085 [Bacteriovorax sp. MedPE-SWde]